MSPQYALGLLISRTGSPSNAPLVWAYGDITTAHADRSQTSCVRLPVQSRASVKGCVEEGGRSGRRPGDCLLKSPISREALCVLPVYLRIIGDHEKAEGSGAVVSAFANLPRLMTLPTPPTALCA